MKNLSSSASMDRHGWQSLGHDLQLAIMSVLKRWNDRCSLQAVMETSRDLRLLASSLISSIDIRDASDLAHYPRHAAAITSLRLMMRRSIFSFFSDKVHMEPPFMVNWLRSTSAACNRLAAVTSVRVELPSRPKPSTELMAMEPGVMGSLLAAIGQACPNLRSLHVDGIDRVDEDLIRTTFTAIGRHLPGIVDLRLELDFNEEEAYQNQDFDVAGINWATCLPRGLQKFRSAIRLHHELLQQLAQMPSLAEVAVFTLGNDDDTREVQSGSCAWRILRIGYNFPSCKTLSRFTAAMSLLHLHIYDSACWQLDATSQGEGPAVAKAAAWLSQISNCPEELSIGWGELSPDAASTTGFISALAPLSGLVSLELDHWPVTERTLDELALALPNVSKLFLKHCSISSGAWSRMSSLASVTELRITRPAEGAIPLAQIIAFSSAVSRPMALIFEGGSVSIDDQAGWEAYEEEQRRKMGSLQIVVRMTQ